MPPHHRLKNRLPHKDDEKIKKRKVDPYSDDHRDRPPSALDSLGGDYDEDYSDDFGDEQNPYAAPRRKNSSRKKRGRSSAEALTATQKMFSFAGRIGRIDFWGYSILASIIGNVFVYGGAFIADEAQSRAVGIAYIVMLIISMILSLWVQLALYVKRLHDRNKPGMMVLIAFIPLIGLIWLFVDCGCLAGTPGANDYGPEPP